MGRTIAILLALTLLSGCRERDPEEVAQEFVQTLQAYRASPSDARLERAWALLDDASRAPFEARAEAATASLGVKVEPWTMMRYEGLARGDRALSFETVTLEDDRATVAVGLGWGVPKSAGGPADAPGQTEITLTRTEDGWKVALPLAPRGASLVEEPSPSGPKLDAAPDVAPAVPSGSTPDSGGSPPTTPGTAP